MVRSEGHLCQTVIAGGSRAHPCALEIAHQSEERASMRAAVCGIAFTEIRNRGEMSMRRALHLCTGLVLFTGGVCGVAPAQFKKSARATGVRPPTGRQRASSTQRLR